MGQAVVFRTPGLIPIEAFTTFGVNAKPSTDHPIGRFGTGLKYAIAVLVRNGINPVVHIGDTRFTFYSRDKDFRGKTFAHVYMKKESGLLGSLSISNRRLSFTTELGRDWKLWQAFREIESNTRDENGFTKICYASQVDISRDISSIIVESQEFIDQFYKMNEIFLPKDLPVAHTGPANVIEGRSKTVYFRGIRVRDLPKPSIFTYDIQDSISLTEDRTLKYDFEMMEQVAKTVLRSNDENLIERITTAPEGFWENELRFDYNYEEPSEAFKRVISRNRHRASSSSWSYGRRYIPAAAGSTKIIDRIPWQYDSDCVMDNTGINVFVRDTSAEISDEEFAQVCKDIVDLVNSSRQTEEKPPAVPEEAGTPASAYATPGKPFVGSTEEIPF